MEMLNTVEDVVCSADAERHLTEEVRYSLKPTIKKLAIWLDGIMGRKMPTDVECMTYKKVMQVLKTCNESYAYLMHPKVLVVLKKACSINPNSNYHPHAPKPKTPSPLKSTPTRPPPQASADAPQKIKIQNLGLKRKSKQCDILAKSLVKSFILNEAEEDHTLQEDLDMSDDEPEEGEVLNSDDSVSNESSDVAPPKPKVIMVPDDTQDPDKDDFVVPKTRILPKTVRPIIGVKRPPSPSFIAPPAAANKTVKKHKRAHFADEEEDVVDDEDDDADVPDPTVTAKSPSRGEVKKIFAMLTEIQQDYPVLCQLDKRYYSRKRKVYEFNMLKMAAQHCEYTCAEEFLSLIENEYMFGGEGKATPVWKTLARILAAEHLRNSWILDTAPDVKPDRIKDFVTMLKLFGKCDNWESAARNMFGKMNFVQFQELQNTFGRDGPNFIQDGVNFEL